MINTLLGRVMGLKVSAGIKNSLASKLQVAAAKLTVGDVVGACGSLQAFINEVLADNSQKKISAADAKMLISGDSAKGLAGAETIRAR